MSDTMKPSEPPSISTGPNARPRNENIGQSASGIPDDTGTPVEVDPEEEKRIKRALEGDKENQQKGETQR